MSREVFYTIEKILDRRKIRDKYQYKIKWEGYPMTQCTWEPIENLKNALYLVEEFNKNHPMKNNKSKNNKDLKVLNKKRNNEQKEENINAPKEENNIQNNNIQEKSPNINENNNILTFDIDGSLKKVLTVKKQNEILMAVVEKMKENGEIIKAYLSTEDLRKSNPWILLDFYESKIKFT